MPFPLLFIDFDSTFVTLESLDELASIVLASHPDSARLTEEIEAITEAGMTGQIDYATSLQRRLDLFKPSRGHINELIRLLEGSITASIRDNQQFFIKHAAKIYIISGGFQDFIWPVVRPFGLAENHILANRFIFEGNEVVDYDKNSYLCQDHGKSKQIEALNLTGQKWMIGDGYTDYQVKADGVADKFIAFTENVSRQKVIENADAVMNSFDEIIKNIPR